MTFRILQVNDGRVIRNHDDHAVTIHIGDGSRERKVMEGASGIDGIS